MMQFHIVKHIMFTKDTMRAASLSLAEALYIVSAPLYHVMQQSVSGPARLRVCVH